MVNSRRFGNRLLHGGLLDSSGPLSRGGLLGGTRFGHAGGFGTGWGLLPDSGNLRSGGGKWRWKRGRHCLSDIGAWFGARVAGAGES